MFLTQEFCKELEVKTSLKASVISSGSLILLLGEREQNTETQKISKITNPPRTSTPAGNTTTSEDLQPSEGGSSVILDSNPEESSSVDLTFTPETTASSIQNIPEGTLSTTERSESNEGVVSEEPTSPALDLSVKQEMVLSPVLLTLQFQLSQLEQDWVEMQTRIPSVQQGLHLVRFSLYFNLSEITVCTSSLTNCSMNYWKKGM